MRKLAEGLYVRGARIQIGTPIPTQHIFIHHSIDPLGKILWTGRRWNQVMGYNSQAAVGRHISEFIEPASYQAFHDFTLPELVQYGKVEGVPIVLVTSTKEHLNATLKSEILRDEKGGFLRTFAKLKVAIPAAFARMAATASLALMVA